MAEKQSVNKVGITDAVNPFTRLNKYEKGSQPLYVIYVNLSGDELKNLEKMLLEKLGNQFIKRTDYGAEYFECEFQKIKYVVDSTLAPYMNCTQINKDITPKPCDEYKIYWNTAENVYVSPYDKTKYTTASSFKKHMIQKENAEIKRQKKIKKQTMKAGADFLKKNGIISSSTAKLAENFL